MSLPQSAAFTSPLVHICVTLVTLCFFTKTAQGRGGCLLKPQLPISCFAFVPRITLNKIKPRRYYLFRGQTKEPNAGANNSEIGSSAFDEGRHGKTQLWLVGEQPEGSVKKRLIRQLQGQVFGGEL